MPSHDERRQHNAPRPLEKEDRARPCGEPLETRIRGSSPRGECSGRIGFQRPSLSKTISQTIIVSRGSACGLFTQFCRMIFSKQSVIIQKIML